MRKRIDVLEHEKVHTSLKITPERADELFLILKGYLLNERYNTNVIVSIWNDPMFTDEEVLYLTFLIGMEAGLENSRTFKSILSQLKVNL